MKMCNHRLIAIVLSCLLCFTAVPITAFAVGAAGTEETMTEETGTEAATASVEEMTEDFTDASMDGTETGEAAESTDVEIEEPPAPETEAASDTETAETSDPEAETPPADTSDPETEEPPAETPGTETEEPPVDEPMETPPAETPAVQPEYRVQVDAVEGYHNQPVALTIRLEDVGGTGWTKLEASTEENAPEKRADLTEALQKDGAAPYTVSTNGTVYFFITDPAGTEHKETYTVDFFDYDPPAVEAGIHNKTLTVEATDLRSGVAGIYVNGQLYTTIKNGQLELPIDGCTEDRLFSIRAKDRLGNRSDSLTLSNPYYKEPEEEDTEKDTKQEHDEHCPEDCDCRKEQTTTQPSTPGTTTGSAPVSTTSAPVTTLSGGSTGGTGASSGSTGGTTTSGTTSKESASNKEESASETVTKEPGTGFSGEGNAVARDLLYDKHTNKQFITITDRDGNTFYMVIDYDSPINEEEEQYQTYFLNPVDLADLEGLAADGGTAEAPAVCSCTERCQPGEVNLGCEVCSQDMTACVGKEPVEEEPEEPAETEPEEPEESGGVNPAVLLGLLALIGGGGAFAYFKLVKNKPKTRGNADLDDYDYGDEEDSDEDEIPWESEDEDGSDAEPDEDGTE